MSSGYQLDPQHMTRVTAHLEINTIELQWLAGYAAKRDISIDAAARQAIRVLNLIEETSGAWAALESACGKAVGPKYLPNPLQALQVEQDEESGRCAGILALLDKLSAVPSLAEELKAARISLAPVLYPNGGDQYARLMEGGPSVTRLNATQMYDKFFGPDAQPIEGFERLSQPLPESLSGIDLSLEA